MALYVDWISFSGELSLYWSLGGVDFLWKFCFSWIGFPWENFFHPFHGNLILKRSGNDFWRALLIAIIQENSHWGVPKPPKFSDWNIANAGFWNSENFRRSEGSGPETVGNLRCFFPFFANPPNQIRAAVGKFLLVYMPNYNYLLLRSLLYQTKENVFFFS